MHANDLNRHLTTFVSPIITLKCSQTTIQTFACIYGYALPHIACQQQTCGLLDYQTSVLALTNPLGCNLISIATLTDLVSQSLSPCSY